MPSELEPIEPNEAVQMYLTERSSELAASSLKAHEYRLSHLIRWCEERRIENLNTITGRKLHEYKTWRREDGDLNNVTLKTQMDTLRVFIRFCERIDGVPKNLSEKIQSPSLAAGENRRTVLLDHEDASSLLSYLERFRYASFDHVLLLLLWRTGVRTGGVRTLDVTDYHPKKARLRLEHRPDTETPLKNGKEGERLIAISPETVSVLDDWIEYNRPETPDEYGRQPLLTTINGRVSSSAIRETVYRLTRPCEYTGECPHGREQESCEALNTGHGWASKCPSSVSPHAIRRGSITHFLSRDVPEKVVRDRMNVSSSVLSEHYDSRSEEQKVEQRRGYLSNV